MTKHKTTSRLLVGEHPLVLIPTLAEYIGLEFNTIGDRHAIALQQVHYWLDMNMKTESKKPVKNRFHFRDGRWWTYNTYKEWREGNFRFWKERLVRKIFSELEGMGLLISEQFGASKGNQTKWYSIDYDALEALYIKHSPDVTESDTPLTESVSPMSESVGSYTETSFSETSPETSEYTQSISDENADSTFELTGNFTNESGSKTIDSKASGTASPGTNPDSCGANENDYHSQNEPYAKPWHKDEPLRLDEDGYAVLPPADKHKMPRQTAVKLAQYVLLAENDTRFELMLPDPSDCLDDEYPTDCWVTSKNNCTWYRENELETIEPLRALRNVNEDNGGLDFNELLNDCWRAATSLWDEDDALALFKRTPLPVIFEDFLEDYGVEVIDYDFDELCPL